MMNKYLAIARSHFHVIYEPLYLNILFRTIKLNNKAFNENIGRHSEAVNFMKSCGWYISDNGTSKCLVFPDEKSIKEAHEFLLDNRSVIFR